MQFVLLMMVCVAGYLGLRYQSQRRYASLHARLPALLDRYGAVCFKPLPPVLPDFSARFATLPDSLPTATLSHLQAAADRCAAVERNYVPTHKQGGTIAYATLHDQAPAIVAFYQSPALRELLTALIGVPVVPTPLHDQSSCSLLVYERPQDRIGWHYDHNFYNGRHFTVLLPLVNSNAGRTGLSAATLQIRQRSGDTSVPTPPNTLLVFEGARVLHQVTPLAASERRVILSMTFCTDPQTSWAKGCARRLKDTAFFGLRALWS